MPDVDRLELAWAAGFFDGEGSTYANRQGKRMYPRLTVGQSGDEVPETLYRFKAAVFDIPRIDAKPRVTHGRRPVWVLRASGFVQAQAVLAALWPFLGTTKREQAHRVLTAYLEDPRRGTHGPPALCGAPPHTGHRALDCPTCRDIYRDRERARGRT